MSPRTPIKMMAMIEDTTEREKLLEARVKELEASAAATGQPKGGGGIVEQLWRYFSVFIPPWILVTGLGVFVAFHAWEYFNGAQITARETQFQKAQAAIKDAEQAARNTEVGGEPLEVVTVQAQLKQKQQEAARAKIEADAMNAMIGDESARLAQAQATLAAKQAEATKTRAAADAARTKSGLLTLTQREAIAKLVATQMDAAEKRIAAALTNSPNNEAAILRAACEGNQFPELIGCPDEYAQQARTQGRWTAIHRLHRPHRRVILPPQESDFASRRCSIARGHRWVRITSSALRRS